MPRSLVFALLLVSTTAFGATRTWTGTTNGQWTLSSNWGGTAPVAGDSLVFPAGASNLTNSNDFPAGTSFNQITLNGGGYVLSGNLVVLTGITSSTGTNTIGLSLRLNGLPAKFTVTGGTLVINGNVDLNGFGLTLDAPAGSGQLNGIISGTGAGTDALIKLSSGDWTLSNANTFAGRVVIQSGRLIAKNQNALGIADNTDLNGTLVNSGGTLVLGTGLTFPAEHLTLNGSGQGGNGVLQSTGSSTLTGTVVLASDTAMNLLLGQEIDFNGQITGSGGFGMGNGGIYYLNNSTNDFSGGVQWGATGSSTSTLAIGAPNSIPTSTAINVGAGGLFNVNGSLQTIASLAGSGNVDLGCCGPILAIIGSAVTTYSGVISGQFVGIGGIVHSGGSLTLTGVSTYTGAYSNYAGTTAVVGGTLPLQYSQVAGVLAVASSGTIGKLIITGGVFAPGSGGTGVANTGDVGLAAAVTYSEFINGTAPVSYSNVHATGTVNLADATFSLSGSGAGVAPGNSFTIIDNDGSDPVVGTFAGLPNGAIIAGGPGGFRYQIAYNGGTGNDVVLTALAPLTATTTTLASSNNPSSAGQSVTFTATVSGTGGTPTGTVSFFDGVALLGSGTLNGSGMATFSTSNLTAGPHTITAMYNGDVTFASSTSAPLIQNVSAAIPALDPRTLIALALALGVVAVIALRR